MYKMVIEASRGDRTPIPARLSATTRTQFALAVAELSLDIYGKKNGGPFRRSDFYEHGFTEEQWINAMGVLRRIGFTTENNGARIVYVWPGEEAPNLELIEEKLLSDAELADQKRSEQRASVKTKKRLKLGKARTRRREEKETETEDEGVSMSIYQSAGKKLRKGVKLVETQIRKAKLEEEKTTIDQEQLQAQPVEVFTTKTEPQPGAQDLIDFLRSGGSNITFSEIKNHFRNTRFGDMVFLRSALKAMERAGLISVRDSFGEDVYAATLSNHGR